MLKACAVLHQGVTVSPAFPDHKDNLLETPRLPTVRALIRGNSQKTQILPWTPNGALLWS